MSRGGFTVNDLPPELRRQVRAKRAKGDAAPLPAPTSLAAAACIDLVLEVPGPPRTKKNHNRRIWRNVDGKQVQFEIPSAAAEDYANRVRRAFLALPAAARARCPSPIAIALHVRATFYVDGVGARGDLHGYEQSLADALQAAGAYADDLAIRSWDGTRVVLGDPNPRTVVRVVPLFTYSAGA